MNLSLKLIIVLCILFNSILNAQWTSSQILEHKNYSPINSKMQSPIPASNKYSTLERLSKPDYKETLREMDLSDSVQEVLFEIKIFYSWIKSPKKETFPPEIVEQFFDNNSELAGVQIAETFFNSQKYSLSVLISALEVQDFNFVVLHIMRGFSKKNYTEANFIADFMLAIYAQVQDRIELENNVNPYSSYAEDLSWSLLYVSLGLMVSKTSLYYLSTKFTPSNYRKIVTFFNKRTLLNLKSISKSRKIINRASQKVANKGKAKFKPGTPGGKVAALAKKVDKKIVSRYDKIRKGIRKGSQKTGSLIKRAYSRVTRNKKVSNKRKPTEITTKVESSGLGPAVNPRANGSLSTPFKTQNSRYIAYAAIASGVGSATYNLITNKDENIRIDPRKLVLNELFLNACKIKTNLQNIRKETKLISGLDIDKINADFERTNKLPSHLQLKDIYEFKARESVSNLARIVDSFENLRHKMNGLDHGKIATYFSSYNDVNDFELNKLPNIAELTSLKKAVLNTFACQSVSFEPMRNDIAQINNRLAFLKVIQLELVRKNKIMLAKRKIATLDREINKLRKKDKNTPKKVTPKSINREKNRKEYIRRKVVERNKARKYLATLLPVQNSNSKEIKVEGTSIKTKLVNKTATKPIVAKKVVAKKVVAKKVVAKKVVAKKVVVKKVVAKKVVAKKVALDLLKDILSRPQRPRGRSRLNIVKLDKLTKLIFVTKNIEAYFAVLEYIRSNWESYPNESMVVTRYIQTVWENKYLYKYQKQLQANGERIVDISSGSMLATASIILWNKVKFLPVYLGLYRTAFAKAGIAAYTSYEAYNIYKRQQKHRKLAILPAPAVVLDFGAPLQDHEKLLQDELDKMGVMISSLGVTLATDYLLTGARAARGLQAASMTGGRIAKQLLVAALVFYIVDSSLQAAVGSMRYNQVLNKYIKAKNDLLNSDSSKPYALRMQKYANMVSLMTLFLNKDALKVHKDFKYNDSVLRMKSLVLKRDNLYTNVITKMKLIELEKQRQDLLEAYKVDLQYAIESHFFSRKRGCYSLFSEYLFLQEALKEGQTIETIRNSKYLSTKSKSFLSIHQSMQFGKSRATCSRINSNKKNLSTYAIRKSCFNIDKSRDFRTLELNDVLFKKSLRVRVARLKLRFRNEHRRNSFCGNANLFTLQSLDFLGTLPNNPVVDYQINKLKNMFIKR